MFEIVLYRTPAGRALVEEYMKDLIKCHKETEVAAIISYQKRLSDHGLQVNAVHPGTIKRVRENIYELRPHTTRIFFFCVKDNKIILLHAIEKKRQQLPSNEIDKAIQERDSYLRRNKNGERT